MNSNKMRSPDAWAWKAWACVWIVAAAEASWAAPAIDVSNDVGGSSAALGLLRNNFFAQSFTVTSEGLLTQIDMQIGKFAGGTGDLEFELREMVNGAPTLDDKGILYSTTLDIASLPQIGSLSNPTPFTSIDVSSVGIHATPGEQYAVSVIRGGSTAEAGWRSRPGSYDGGTGWFRSLLNQPWTTTFEEFGFQAWVDPEPTLPYKLRIDPTFDMEYRPGDVATLIDGGDTLLIGGLPGSEILPEQRPIMEYSVDGLPRDATIVGAELDVDPFASSGAPRIEVVGYAGDGLASFSDTTASGPILAVTPPTSAGDPAVFTLDTASVARLAESSSHVGLRLRSLDNPEYLGFYASEEDFPTVLPPRLTLAYTLPRLRADLDSDDDVDVADILEWQRGYPDSYTTADLTRWEGEFGESDSALAVAAVPEPGLGLCGVLVFALLFRGGGRAGLLMR